MALAARTPKSDHLCGQTGGWTGAAAGGGGGSRMYRIITWAVGLCSLPSTLIPSGEQKEPWVLALAGSTGPYKVHSRSGDLSFCHLSELTVKPSDAGETSRWNITGAAGVDCRVFLGSLSDLFYQELCSSESSIPPHDLWKLLLYLCCLHVSRRVSPSSPGPGNTTYGQPSDGAAGLFNSSDVVQGLKHAFCVTSRVFIMHEGEGRCWLSEVAENLKLMEICTSPTAKKPSVEEEPSTVPDAR